MYGVEGDNLSRWYKYHISDYKEWEQRDHAMEYVLFKENPGERLSMDETALSQGELYTIVTNKAGHGGKGLCWRKSNLLSQFTNNKIMNP